MLPAYLDRLMAAQPSDVSSKALSEEVAAGIDISLRDWKCRKEEHTVSRAAVAVVGGQMGVTWFSDEALQTLNLDASSLGEVLLIADGVDGSQQVCGKARLRPEQYGGALDDTHGLQWAVQNILSQLARTDAATVGQLLVAFKPVPDQQNAELQLMPVNSELEGGKACGELPALHVSMVLASGETPTVRLTAEDILHDSHLRRTCQRRGRNSVSFPYEHAMRSHDRALPLDTLASTTLGLPSETRRRFEVSVGGVVLGTVPVPPRGHGLDLWLPIKQALQWGTHRALLLAGNTAGDNLSTTSAPDQPGLVTSPAESALADRLQEGASAMGPLHAAAVHGTISAATLEAEAGFAAESYNTLNDYEELELHLQLTRVENESRIDMAVITEDGEALPLDGNAMPLWLQDSNSWQEGEPTDSYNAAAV